MFTPSLWCSIRKILERNAGVIAHCSSSHGLYSSFLFPVSLFLAPPGRAPLLAKVKGSRGMSCTEAVKADGYFVHKVCVSALFSSISISWHTRTAHILLVWEDKSVSSPWAEAEAELLWRRFSHLYCTSSMKSVLWKSACLGSWLCH